MGLTALVYARTLTFPFVYEDLNDVERTFGAIGWPGWHRLLTSLSFTLSRGLSGIEPWGWHLVSVLWHVANGALLWRLLDRSWVAVFALGMVLLHPLQVESVAYVSSRPDLVMTAMILGGLLAVDRGWWALALGACVAAVLAKEAGLVAFPLVLWWALWRGRMTAGPVIAVVLVAGVMGLILASRFQANLGLDPHYTVTELTKALTLGSCVLVPVGLTIDHDWGWITSPSVALAVFTCALWGAVALVDWRSRVAFAFVWCAIALAPRLLVPLLEGLHEHHLYLPLFGVALAIGARPQESSL